MQSESWFQHLKKPLAKWYDLSFSISDAREFFTCTALISLFLLRFSNITGQPAEKGQWSPAFDLPTHPEQMVVLPSGKVLMWPWAPDRRTPPHGPLALWNPEDDMAIVFSNTGIESASGLAFQPDGVLLSAGGDQPDGGVDGNKRSFIFDFKTNVVQEIKSMSSGRVYPSATTLANGNILVLAGLDEKKRVNAIPELWDGHQWTSIPIARNKKSSGPTFQFLTSDGRIFRAGPERISDWLDLTTFKWSILPSKARNNIRFQGTAVLYDEDQILLTGGCPKHDCVGVQAVSSAEVINLQNKDPEWQSVPNMHYPRHSHHATLLPDGKVLITGGTAKPGIYNSDTTGILAVELWDPSQRKFILMAPMSEIKHFQSTAVLLPDARVLVAGGAFGTYWGDATFSCKGQIFSPPYLFKGERPEIIAAPVEIQYADQFQLETAFPASIQTISLMGLSASSQTWNANQRIIWLHFFKEGQILKIMAPENPNEAPPGYYLLFILNARGVPSKGHMILLSKQRNE